MQKPIYVYYELTNFIQSHAEYVLSYDTLQLLGDYKRTTGQLDKQCDPLTEISLDSGDTKRLNPCGLIANSLFNGALPRRTKCWFRFLLVLIIGIHYLFTADQITLSTPGKSMTTKGISWPLEKSKYHQVRQESPRTKAKWFPTPAYWSVFVLVSAW
jgi:hypothetical protein